MERIAVELGLTIDDLCERLADAIEHGPARVRERIMAVVYRKAVGGSVTAPRLWWKHHGQEGA